jgi:hypothetical protein
MFQASMVTLERFALLLSTRAAFNNALLLSYLVSLIVYRLYSSPFQAFQVPKLLQLRHCMQCITILFGVVNDVHKRYS